MGNNNSNNNNWWNTGVGSGVSELWGMIGGHGQERRGYRNNRNLMQFQYENQRRLNEQGRDIQMDIWNKTNAAAQVQHYKDAGLNPALMYGTSGATGTTGSQGGGSASMGSSQQGRVMDMQNALIGAQIDGIKAKAESDRANADATSGYQKDESVSQTYLNVTLSNNNKATLDLIKANTKYRNVETDIKEIEKSTTLEQLSENINKTIAETRKLNTDNDLTVANMDNIVRLTAAQSWKTINENRLIDSKIGLTNVQINKIGTEIDVMLGNLDVNIGKLNEEQKRTILTKMDLDLKKVLTEMNIDSAQKIEIMRSLTKIFTSLMGNITELGVNTMPKRQ